jgi:hypothetical protein
MKKLLLVVAAAFFNAAACAQVELPTTQNDNYGAKELKCTEEAISFRADIRSGWQLHSFRIGYTDIASNSPGFTASKDYNEKDIIPEPIQLVKFENSFNPDDIYFNRNILFLKNPFPASSKQTDLPANTYNNYIKFFTASKL